MCVLIRSLLFSHNRLTTPNDLASHQQVLAFCITLLLTVMLALGVKESTRFNSLFTGINLLVVMFVIVYGALKVDLHNWNLPKEEVKGHGEGGFAPYGISGIMAGAATCFYGFIGSCAGTLSRINQHNS